MQESQQIETRLELAIKIAKEAGDLTLEYFNRPDLVVERKENDSPVTVADRQAEEHLRRRIAETFPDDAIHGEECDDRPGQTDFRWILDPIDGTKSFIHGVPLYATLVAVEYQGRSVAGVIRIPALDESIHAAIGQGAWHSCGNEPPRKAKVSTCPRLAEGLFVTSEVATFEEMKCRDVYDRLQSATRLSRSWGDAYGYLLVATGRAEVMVDPEMEVWDAGPLPPILTEAGGTFTDWQGETRIDSGRGVATNGHILDEVMEILK